MHTLWNASDRESILRRFRQLSPNTRPKWGKLDAPHMVTHVTDALRAGLGEVVPNPIKSPLQHWPINALVMFYLPWPKGARTAPELLNRKPLELDSEIESLRAAIDRFLARDIQGPWPIHFAFGRMRGDQWGRLMYRHLDYHLRQFGG